MNEPTVTAGPAPPRKECRHDSTRRDGALDTHCLKCGEDGYWHHGHSHFKVHPSGKVLVSLGCPDEAEPETPS